MTLSTHDSTLVATGAPRAGQARFRFPTWLLAAFLALVTVALYWPTTRCAFINCDDPEYVYENSQLQKGLTWDNLAWVFVNPVLSNWHPLTMLSYQIDYKISGLNPGGFHRTNLLLHAVNTMLVFLLLHKLTGARWRSWLVAALFGWHPLHVESVAWVAERKDVLSTLFWLLTLWAYAKYLAAAPSKSKFWYGTALTLFAFGLMSKAMLVTLPCVLLLLDYWPFERFKTAGGRQLVIEKTPFFLLALVTSWVTFVVQQQAGAVMSVEGFPLSTRVGNALISYCRYLLKMFWPTHLAAYYPHPGDWPMEQVLLAAIILCVLSLIFFKLRQRYPFLLVGWLWFVGTLVPVIGLVQVGEQAMADRYTYIPSLGVFILVIWGAYKFSKRWRHLVTLGWATGIATSVLCLAVTRQQISYWQDSESLFRHTVAVTENNELAHNDLGLALLGKGQIPEAISHFKEAARLKPAAAEIHNNLGIAYLNQGDTDAAVAEFQESLRYKPGFLNAHMNLGLARFKNGESDEAISQFQEALALNPDFIEARMNLGVVLLKKGQNDEAALQFQAALQVKPNDENSHFNLAVAFLNQGLADEAIAEFQTALRLNPADAEAKTRLANAQELKRKIDLWSHHPIALNNLAWELATSPNDAIRNGSLAVKLAESACEQTHYRVTVLIGTLAAAYAEARRFEEAIATGQKASALATELGETNLLKRNQALVALYQSHQPYHEPPANSPAKPTPSVP